MPIQLVPLNPGFGPRVSIERPVMLVGRHPDCDVRLESPQISRRHCCLALAYDRVIVRDLGSRHGLWVNGDAVDERELKAGDEVAIGPVLFQVIDPSRPAPQPVQAASNTPPARPRPPSLPELDRPTGEVVALSDLLTDL
ncbi:MAG: FHA domain-containing protein [Isosphaeraceae bacterium]